jgi:hypothetical protein
MAYSAARKLCHALAASVAGLLLTFIPVESKALEMHVGADPLPGDAIFPLRFAGGFCVDAACSEGWPGGWVGQSYPALGIGETASFTSTSASSGHYLGNTLSGTFNVSVSPAFRVPGYSTEAYGAVPPQDELLVNIVDGYSYLAKTDFGRSSFTAQAGTDYYLLLEGRVLGGNTYTLQVVQVPEPASWLLFSLGIGTFLVLRRRETVCQSLV